MSKRSDLEYLHDITEAINRICFYTDNFSYKRFLNDIKTQDAVVRNLEIIGEAVKKISGALRQKLSLGATGPRSGINLFIIILV